MEDFNAKVVKQENPKEQGIDLTKIIVKEHIYLNLNLVKYFTTQILYKST